MLSVSKGMGRLCADGSMPECWEFERDGKNDSLCRDVHHGDRVSHGDNAPFLPLDPLSQTFTGDRSGGRRCVDREKRDGQEVGECRAEIKSHSVESACSMDRSLIGMAVAS